MTNQITVTWESVNPKMEPTFAVDIETEHVAEAKDAAITVLQILLDAYVKAGCDRENARRCMLADVEEKLGTGMEMAAGYSILLPYEATEKAE